MQRVLFVHHRPQLGGAVTSLALIIRELASTWDVHVVAPSGPAAMVFAGAGATVHAGPVPAFVHTWDVQYRGFRWTVAGREALSVVPHRRALGRLLEALRPDIVHLNDIVLLPTAAFAARRGARVVWHIRSSLHAGGRDRRSTLVGRAVDRYAQAVVAIDDDVARTLQTSRPIYTIQNPVAVDDEPALDLGAPSGRVTVGLFGHLRRQKGWPRFLDALRLLIDRDVAVHGVVVGGAVRPKTAFRGPRGPILAAAGVPNEQADFEAHVQRLGLSPHLTVLPFAERPGGAYRALDIVTFPNEGVGLGRPVLEAAAYGRPTVASGSMDGGGVLEPGVTGLLVPSGDVAALADGIERLAVDEALRGRMGAAARAHAVAFDPANVAQRVEAVWRDVMSAKR